MKPDKTFKIDGDGTIRGMISGLEAVKQAIMLMLDTERFRYAIYSWDYGTETEGLIGGAADRVKSELEEKVRAALFQDDRIIGINGFEAVINRRSISCSFTVKTIFGDTQIEAELSA